MGSDPKKVYGFEEVAKHDQTNDCWVIIHGKVYDVSPFMEDHAGSEVLLATTRKDASKDFEQVGHSEDARNMMGKYYIGEIDYMSTVPSKRLYTGSPRRPQAQDGINSHYKNPDFVIKALQFLLVPLLILASAFLVRRSLHQGEKSRRLRNISTSCRSNNTSVIAEANISLMQ